MCLFVFTIYKLCFSHAMLLCLHVTHTALQPSKLCNLFYGQVGGSNTSTTSYQRPNNPTKRKKGTQWCNNCLTSLTLLFISFYWFIVAAPEIAIFSCVFIWFKVDTDHNNDFKSGSRVLRSVTLLFLFVCLCRCAVHPYLEPQQPLNTSMKAKKRPGERKRGREAVCRLVSVQQHANMFSHKTQKERKTSRETESESERRDVMQLWLRGTKCQVVLC